MIILNQSLYNYNNVLESYGMPETSLIKDDSLDEATNVTDAKIVKEKKGSGISVKVNGIEYRYVSKDKSTDDLFHSFNGILKHGNAGYRALNWLRKSALRYYGGQESTLSDEGKKLVGISESTLSKDDRANLNKSDFGLPKDRKYPMPDKAHVLSAISYFNKCDNSKKNELAKNICKELTKYPDISISKNTEFYTYYSKYAKN
jgi:hypothetical protein